MSNTIRRPSPKVEPPFSEQFLPVPCLHGFLLSSCNKVFKYIFSLTLCLTFVTQCLFEYKTTTFNCTSSFKSIGPRVECFAKSYSRKNTQINISFDITRKLYDVKGHFEIKHRTLTPYYRVIINNTLDFCGFLNGTDKNVLTKWMISTVSKTVGKRIVHPCPYFGPIRIVNMTAENEMSAQFIKGYYKMTFIMFDDIDNNIITTIHETELK
ncbi:CLUMA_CG007905, isoform A [Clunio marinus]|uniref:CLUMA_CG007905, isoform A n=1 Tax=Clunio marinus TaxID=568069 RepID=A0A1J1I630_9DIPT|nr:CLUMA_CG007905, isoform A [Clunio marinus]